MYLPRHKRAPKILFSVAALCADRGARHVAAAPPSAFVRLFIARRGVCLCSLHFRRRGSRPRGSGLSLASRSSVLAPRSRWRPSARLKSYCARSPRPPPAPLRHVAGAVGASPPPWAGGVYDVTKPDCRFTWQVGHAKSAARL